MKTLDEAIKKVTSFRDARDWKQFHNPKDLSLSLVLEATEVMEHFQWKSKEEIDKYIKTNRADIGEELADVFYWVILMSHDLGIDILNALEIKLKKNDEKYPVDKAKGKHTKYNRFK
ncbi:MAG: nucleotide pyrophosphohydrolase [Patescibacteria group bacterium]